MTDFAQLSCATVAKHFLNKKKHVSRQGDRVCVFLRPGAEHPAGEQVAVLPSGSLGAFCRPTALLSSWTITTLSRARRLLHTRTVILYTLANVFMLAHPYGYPKVMNSYPKIISTSAGMTRAHLRARSTAAEMWPAAMANLGFANIDGRPSQTW